jgi:hypothetical protein
MRVRSHRTFRHLKSLLAIQICLVLGGVLVIAVHAQMPTTGGSVASQEIQDLRLKNLEDTVHVNSGRITDMEHDLYMWKGAVVGFGGLISLLEMIQALGLSRAPRVQVARIRKTLNEE